MSVPVDVDMGAGARAPYAHVRRPEKVTECPVRLGLSLNLELI